MTIPILLVGFLSLAWLCFAFLRPRAVTTVDGEPTIVHHSELVQVDKNPDGSMKITFDFYDNGIDYSFQIDVNADGTAKVTAEEFAPRMVKHDEIDETKIG